MAFSYDINTESNGGGPNKVLIDMTGMVISAGASAVFCLLQAVDGTEANIAATVTWDDDGTPDAMTELVVDWDSTTLHESSIWGLLAPDTGTKTMHIAFAGTVARAVAYCLGVSGGSTTTLAKTTQSAGPGSSQPQPTLTITTQTDGSAVLAVVGHRDDAVPAGQQTVLYESLGPGGSDGYGAQRAEKATAGNQTMNWTGFAGGGDNWKCAAIEYEVATGAAAIAPGPLMMGV